LTKLAMPDFVVLVRSQGMRRRGPVVNGGSGSELMGKLRKSFLTFSDHMIDFYRFLRCISGF